MVTVKFKKYKHTTKRVCHSNENNGMDIMIVLMRDKGIQLSKLLSLARNNSRKLGNSIVYTYKLATRSSLHFIRNNQREDNMFTRTTLCIQASVK